jgi:uncharacterized protein YndB with AHSA1/START domain
MAQSQTASQITLRIRRTFAAPRERVFRAWTDASELASWFAPSPDFAIVIPELDLRVGGKCQVEMHHKSGTVHRLHSVYREVKPPEKIAFTWQWEAEAAAETLVTVEFFELQKNDSGGSTEVVLTHERFTSEEEKQKHDHGWAGCLDQLANIL